MKPPSFPSRGLTLIELMVSLAIGMLLVATALLAVGHQLRDTRQLQREQRLTQDLRAAADMITRDLRRASHWHGAEAGVKLGPEAGGRRNPHVVSFASSGSQPGPGAPSGSDQVDFSYSNGPPDNSNGGDGDGDASPEAIPSNERFGYRLKDGVIEVHLGGAGWQALTDPARLTVTGLQLRPHHQLLRFDGACAKACPPDATPGPGACPPQQAVVHVDVAITAGAVADPRLLSRLDTRVRLRNDMLSGACPP